MGSFRSQEEQRPEWGGLLSTQASPQEDILPEALEETVARHGQQLLRVCPDEPLEPFLANLSDSRPGLEGHSPLGLVDSRPGVGGHSPLGLVDIPLGLVDSPLGLEDRIPLEVEDSRLEEEGVSQGNQGSPG